MLTQSLKDLETSVNAFKKNFRDRVEGFQRDVEESNKRLNQIISEEPVESNKNIEDLLLEINDFIDNADKDKNAKSFLREVEKEMKGLLESIKDEGLKKKANIIMKKLKEQAPEGSLEGHSEKIHLAFKDSGIFAKDNDGYMNAWIRFVFMDKIIVKSEDKQYLISYAIVDDKVIFGEKKEVEEVFVVKEAQKNDHLKFEHKDIKEKKFRITQKVKDFDKLDTITLSLKEAKLEEGEKDLFVEAVLIEAGTNPGKKRHYPISTIKEAAPHFAGLKMYINHPTAIEEQTRPERDLRDWVATIQESSFDSGKAVGKIKVHDEWLKNMLRDSVVREHIGLSINTGGRISYGMVEGQEMQIVEQIVFQRKNGPVSVDWVTEPGARGRVAQLLESRTKERTMLENLTLTELKENRSDIYDMIVKEAKAEAGKDAEALKVKLQEAEKKNAEFEKKEKIGAQISEVREALKGSKLPEAAKQRIIGKFSAGIVEDVKEGIKKEIEAEANYISELSGKGKISMSQSEKTEGSLVESMAKELEARAGIKEEKKDED